MAVLPRNHRIVSKPTKVMAEKKARRVKVKPVMRRKVANFYEGDPNARLHCIITKKDVEVEIHHLDENPAHSDIEFNLLPLHSGLNKNIDKREGRSLDERLSTQGLSNKSGFYYSRGNYAYGYGCSILGASLGYYVPWKARRSSNYFINADDVAFFCANALVNLRPLNRLDYATHVLKGIVVPLVDQFGNTIERRTCARLAMEIGSYFRDAGHYLRARNFSQLARHTLRNERQSMSIQTLLARLWHHDGIAAISEGNLKLADNCFEKAHRLITSDYSIGHANESLYEAQILLRSDQPQFDRIAHILKRFPSSSDPRFLTKWTNIELRISEAQADFQKNDQRSKDRAFSSIRMILDDLVKEGVVPTRAIFAPVLHAFADEHRSHKLDIQGMIRVLPLAFRNAATKVEKKLKELSDA